MGKEFFTIDGNYAASHVAYNFSDVAAIYPITPSSPMGENADEMATKGRVNLFGQKLSIMEMQSEGGAAGAVHGSLQAGALTTTFTASQGLLLKIPNMYKIAGELIPAVFHVSARSIACSALSIFGDHSDVMAARQTGFAMLASSSIQESQDMALISHVATLETRVPFLHFFDGFRTSHEVQKVEKITDEMMNQVLDRKLVDEFRKRSMSPDHPDTRGTAQNPDIFFQAREGTNTYYNECPDKVEAVMKKVGKVIGRNYDLFDYCGAKDADKVIIIMGSGADTVFETVEHMNANGSKVGVVNVHLYRPFSIKHFMKSLPKSVKSIAVLDRTKEPGSIGEPLYLDILSAITQEGRSDIKVVGGRYGLSSKEFTPGHVSAIFKNLDASKPKHGFTVGINDDVTNLSLEEDKNIDVSKPGTVQAKFYGLGSDGTVGANKNSIKIIGDNTENYAQGYFVYDSKKSGGITVSHLRFGKERIRSPYLIQRADFVAVHNQSFLGRYDVLEGIKEGGTFLMNSVYSQEEAFDKLPYDIQKTIIDKKLNFYNVNAYKIVKEVGLGNRINVAMQAAFFMISGILPKEEATALIKDAIEKTYGRKGKEIVDKNKKAVDLAEAALVKVEVPSAPTSENKPFKLGADEVGGFVSEVAAVIMRDKGNDLPVSKVPYDGTFPHGVTQHEKRGIANEVPVWLQEHCIQCNQCSVACPHAVIRAKQIDPAKLNSKPTGFETLKSTTKNDRDLQFAIQLSPMDCTGCGSCYEVCPSKTKALKMTPLSEAKETEIPKYEFFRDLPENVTDGMPVTTMKGSQFKQPLFEFSGACAGCGETPYVKLVTQLYGDRMYIANATGCSSIYGGTAPFSPYTTNAKGQGPAWANSLFEDNAEFGLGMQLAVTQIRDGLALKVDQLMNMEISGEMKAAFSEWKETYHEGEKSKDSSEKVRALLANEVKSVKGDAAALLKDIDKEKDYLNKKSFWIFGGDGWAYDIGYGGLDHVLAVGRDINVLVMDTEVYSNTGGQSSKATPIGATAKFASSGKRISKKELGLITSTYGYVYVASINMGANMAQTARAIAEAEAYKGPSIIIAYSPCISHGIDMRKSLEQGKRATQTGYWPLYRYHPDYAKEGKNPFVYESQEPKMDFINDFVNTEARYKALRNVLGDEGANAVFEDARKDVERKRATYKKLASL